MSPTSFAPRPAQLSDNARAVLAKRYLIKDANGQAVESPEDMFWRVAGVIADVDRRYGANDAIVDRTREQFYTLMAERRFEPNSPTFTGAGRGHGQLSACFVLPIDDTLSNGHSGIYDSLRSMAIIHQSGGGTGFGLSRLRGKGAMVKSSAGVASGPVSFMSLYDRSTEVVKQGGSRRGANMGILRVDHPDVLEFIHCKDDLTKNTNFNISVAITQAFMDAVAIDGSYDLIEPSTQRVVGTLRAREVWEQMIAGAWKTGEPGVFFIDEANKYNPVPHLGDYEATNPCVTGDTLVATADGLVPIAQLAEAGKSVSVALDGRFNAGGWGAGAVPFCSGVKKVFRVSTVEGYEVRVTADHRLYTARGWVEAQHLVAGDVLHLQNQKGGFGAAGTLEEGRVVGWLVGDGHITGDPGMGAVLGFWGADRTLAPAFAATVNRMLADEHGVTTRAIGVGGVPSRDLSTVASLRLRTLLEEQYDVTAATKTSGVSRAILSGSEDLQRGFLQALFTADGTVGGRSPTGASVRLTSISLPLLRDVQRMLLNFGIATRLYRDRHAARTVTFGAREYACQADHELAISRANLATFAREIGFLGDVKPAALLRCLATYGTRGPYRESFTARFASMAPDGEEAVYDLTEPVTHSFVANGLVVHNCGEQALLPYDVCNLGSVNLGVYVEDGGMNWDTLREDIHTAVHFLDNVIDANQYPLPEIDQLAKRIRRIGLGVMGFADALVSLGVRYDSPEGLAFGGQVMEFLDVEGKRASEHLAVNRGAFPEWAQSIWGPDQTCARDAAGNRVRPQQMLRNCNVTTVAPTGTISIIAGCSSGLEPHFAVAFMRRQAGFLLPDVNEDFVAMAKAGGWWSDELMERIASTGTINHPDVPASIQHIFRTANEIPAEWHIRMQAAFQAHCDSAISKTTNFAHTATLDDVRTIYELAHQMHCKGVTVYRDGSRDAQVLSTGATDAATAARTASTSSSDEAADLNERITELERERRELEEKVCRMEGEHLAPRAKRVRPDKLRGTTYRKETPLGVMFVNITEDESGKPFEVFINLGKAGGSAMADAEALGRVISLALRSGVPLMEVHKQIRGISSDRAVGFGASKVLSMPDAVAIALAEWHAERAHGVQESLPMVVRPTVPMGSTLSAAPASMLFAAASASGPGFDSCHGACSDCGAGMIEESGCRHCSNPACGASDCG